MFNKSDLKRNNFMLDGSFAFKGYDWWWHSFTARNEITGEEKPFFIEFFIVNPKLSEEKPTLGQLEENKKNGRLPSYMMVKAGWWGKDKAQLHKFFSLDDVNIDKGTPFRISDKSGEFFLSEKQTRGKIKISFDEAKEHPEWMCDGGELSWDIKIDKKISYNVGYGAGDFFRFLKAFEMYWHAEGMKTEYEGYLICNGVKYILKPENSYGYADKNWGRNFTSPWVWLSSCNLRSVITGKVLDNSVFDIGGGRPKVFFVPLDRKLLGGMYYEGTEYDFNFSKFWTRPRTEFSSEETNDEILWHVKQENKDTVWDIEARCFKKDMLLVNYESPDGKKRHNRLWNGGNGTARIKLYKKLENGLSLIDDIECFNLGCEYGEYCESECE